MHPRPYARLVRLEEKAKAYYDRVRQMKCPRSLYQFQGEFSVDFGFERG
ncbi:MAG TPA: hypothetical protein VMS18_18080 [Candidatus Binatia bacterium]|nr:hypothetical protein [Candidatus Binatia bacterium]